MNPSESSSKGSSKKHQTSSSKNKSEKAASNDDNLSDGSNGDEDKDSADEADDDEESPFRDPPIGYVRLRPSQFKRLPATVFMEYPPELEIKRVDISKLEELGNRKLYYSSYWERICVKNAFLRAGFTKTESNNYWTAMWSKHQNESQLKSLNCLQKVNHFPESWCIGRKDRLSRTLNTMKRLHGSEHFNFHPDSYILPQERDSFQRLVKNELATALQRNTPAASLPLWILKPVASSCGRGIRVITAQQALQLPLKKKALLQRYLMKPYLIDGKKFDLRIYVLVSGVDPLRIYIHDEGLTRISTSKYSLNNISNRFAHLTNYSVNKKASVFKAAALGSPSGNTNKDGFPAAAGDDPTGTTAAPEPNDPETEGFKWSLTAFRRWLARQTSQVVMEETFARIHDLCVKTIIAAEGDITPNLYTANYRTNCYELFGMDVILDQQLQPSLLEVNVSPSLMGSSPLDKRIKGTVIADLLHIVGIYPHDPKILKKYDVDCESPSSSNNNNRGVARGDEQYNNSYSSQNTGNPFAFTSLTKMMNSQENYRKNPCPSTIDISKLNDNDDSSWLLLLMVEDEFSRAKSSRFHLVHPLPSSCTHYTSLYRNGRFSDHLLAKWIMTGGSRGSNRQYIPGRYLFDPPSRKQSSAAMSKQPQRVLAQTVIHPAPQHSRPTSAHRPSSSSSGLPRPLTAGSRINIRYVSSTSGKASGGKTASAAAAGGVSSQVGSAVTTTDCSPEASVSNQLARGIAAVAAGPEPSESLQDGSREGGGDFSDVDDEELRKVNQLTKELIQSALNAEKKSSNVKAYINSSAQEDFKEDSTSFIVNQQVYQDHLAAQAAAIKRARELELMSIEKAPPRSASAGGGSRRNRQQMTPQQQQPPLPHQRDEHMAVLLNNVSRSSLGQSNSRGQLLSSSSFHIDKAGASGILGGEVSGVGGAEAQQLPQRADLGHGSVLREFDRMIAENMKYNNKTASVTAQASQGGKIMYVSSRGAGGGGGAALEEPSVLTMNTNTNVAENEAAILGSVVLGGSTVSSLGQSRKDGADLQKRIAEMSVAINKALERATIKTVHTDHAVAATAAAAAAAASRTAGSVGTSTAVVPAAAPFSPGQSSKRAKELQEQQKAASQQRQYKLHHETENHYTVGDMKAMGMTNDDLYRLKAHSSTLDVFTNNNRNNKQLIGKIQAHKEQLVGSLAAKKLAAAQAAVKGAGAGGGGKDSNYYTSGSHSARRTNHDHFEFPPSESGSLKSEGTSSRPKTSGGGGGVKMSSSGRTDLKDLHKLPKI